MYDYLLYFLIFSFLGWCAEVAFYFFKTGRFVNRGLAKGPFCPIYGVGISLSYFLLRGVSSFPILVLFSMAITTAVELLVGFITDKILGVRLWDYSSEKGNILGYVCPRFSVIWGFASALAVRLIPRFDGIIALANTPRAQVLVCAVLLVILVDSEREIIKTIKDDART